MFKRKKKFTGHKKKGRPLLDSLDKFVVKSLVKKVPKGIETYHLTLLTIVWSGLIILFSYFASIYSMNWMWLTSLCIALQYLTDVLDGAVGRYRNTGLVKWGYYMDHFLDYVFLCSILIGYSFIVPPEFDFMLFFILAIFGSFIVNAYLAFSATNQFKITFLKFGPTEARLLFIIINTLFIIFGKTYLDFTLPFVLGFSLAGLVLVVYRTQKDIWKIDMRNKNSK